MKKCTPVVLGSDNKEHRQLQSGETLPPDAVPVSAFQGNNISVKDDGLYVPPDGGLRNVTHNRSLAGNGTTLDPLQVRVSTSSKDGRNSLQFLDQEAGGGLYVPPIPKCTRYALTGQFSFAAPDITSDDMACGRFGQGVYWRTVFSLTAAGNGNANVIVAHPQLIYAPCTSDGTIIPHLLRVTHDGNNNNLPPRAAVTLICMTAPTHRINIATKMINEIKRGNNSNPGALDSLYPLHTETIGIEFSLSYYVIA